MTTVELYSSDAANELSFDTIVKTSGTLWIKSSNGFIVSSTELGMSRYPFHIYNVTDMEIEEDTGDLIVEIDVEE
jgi:hypothetical protein